MTFTNTIAREIEARFGSGEHFTKYDLVNVSNEVGKSERAITHVLREMGERGGLRIVGELKNTNGGTPSKIYARIQGSQLVPPADYRTRYHADYQRESNEKEAYRNQCGVRLHEVLNGMTRARLGV